MTYKVVITQGAKAIALDAKETKKVLSSVAASLQLCKDPILSSLGYRIIRFRKHDFLMLYRIEGGIVYVEGMYHELQDYEATFTAERESLC